jgi:hypothetical protein
MNKYDENLTALLGLIIEDLGNMKKDYNAEDLIRFQKLEECFADFKVLCNEQGNVDNTTPVDDLEDLKRYPIEGMRRHQETLLLPNDRMKELKNGLKKEFENQCHFN